jgi:hypothetical protein
MTSAVAQRSGSSSSTATSSKVAATIGPPSQRRTRATVSRRPPLIQVVIRVLDTACPRYRRRSSGSCSLAPIGAVQDDAPLLHQPRPSGAIPLTLCYGRNFGARLASLGIASVRTPVRAPGANAIAERPVRTLRSLGPQSPLPRSPTALGTVVRQPVLVGLHHAYAPSILSSDALCPPSGGSQVHIEWNRTPTSLTGPVGHACDAAL